MQCLENKTQTCAEQRNECKLVIRSDEARISLIAWEQNTKSVPKIAKRASDVMTNKLQDSDKQAGMADYCFLQTRKPSVCQNLVFETKTLPTLPLFLSEHAYVV